MVASKRKSESKGDYTKTLRPRFWHFVSGDSELYTRIIDRSAIRAKVATTFFHTQYELVVDAFTQDFRRDCCDPANNILWKSWRSLRQPSSSKAIEKTKVVAAASQRALAGYVRPTIQPQPGKWPNSQHSLAGRC